MDTKNVFQSLKVISPTIYYLYCALSELEKNNKYNSKEYNEILNKINEIEKLEDSLIDYVDSKGENEIENLCAYAQLDMVGNNKIDRVIHDPSYLISNRIHKNDIVDMRISYKSTLKYVKYILEKESINIFSLYEPIRNQEFINILDKESKMNEFYIYKNMMIDAKYDFKYINCKKSDKKVKDFSESEQEKYKSLMMSELYKYAVKFSKYSQRTLINKQNRRRLILNIDYIRACLNELNEEDINNFRLYLLLNGEELEDKNGLEVFVNALDAYIEDKRNSEGYKHQK